MNLVYVTFHDIQVDTFIEGFYVADIYIKKRILSVISK